MNFRVGGVPEHFNYPWHLVKKHQLLADKDFDFSWADFPGGTGAMCQALREGEIDIALMLTEGATADIIKGNPSRLMGTYVSSRLTWGIHVKAESEFETVADLEGKRFAISRMQSGSHLMAFVNAQQNGWNPQELQFEIVGNFEGAREALRDEKADAFMWEKFTTKPTVDSGEWRRAGVCPTPWPCFSIVVREEILAKYEAQITDLLKVVQSALELLPYEERITFIAEKYGLQAKDVKTWYSETTWLCTPEVEKSSLENVQNTLQKLGIVEEKRTLTDLIAKNTRLI